jgi:hypothetical protein
MMIALAILSILLCCGLAASTEPIAIDDLPLREPQVAVETTDYDLFGRPRTTRMRRFARVPCPNERALLCGSGPDGSSFAETCLDSDVRIGRDEV